ncbi:TPA: 2-C-methyl-D-erythritol 4-phosphate cytidylyltransferase [Candidatus Acetothermia bacterium]|nr:2-C-methyl-D-erythritol 4-phosphate cytidylyltransferase [Candidatus Acetothermia bacterium]
MQTRTGRPLAPSCSTPTAADSGARTRLTRMGPGLEDCPSSALPRGETSVSVSGVILAAGTGTRFGGAESKVWALLGERSLLTHAIEAFVRSGEVDELVVVVRVGEEPRLAALPPVGLPPHVIAGGERRQDSARAGLAVATREYILVHDGARPLVSPDLIGRVLAAARRYGAAVPVLPVVDTLRYARAGLLRRDTVDREGLVQIQTPQGFRRDLLLNAYANAERQGLELPDDAAAVLALGHPVAAVPGDPRNLKITRPEDLTLAARFLGEPVPG